MRPDLILIAVMPSFAATALIFPDSDVPQIIVPGASGSIVLSKRTGIRLCFAGRILVGVQDFSTEIGQLGSFFEIERTYRFRTFYKTGIIIMHAVNIGPYLVSPRPEQPPR